MKKGLKVLALVLLFAMVCSLFAGCSYIENLRARQAFWSGEDIEYKGNIYKKLPKFEYLSPSFNVNEEINITEADVPVLLSKGTSTVAYASSDEYFLRQYISNYDTVHEMEYLSDSVIYCREDKYDEVMEVINNGFESDGLCYVTYDYLYYEKTINVITKEQKAAIDDTLKQVTEQMAPTEYSAGMEHFVTLQEYSHGGIFLKPSKISIAELGNVYYVMRRRNADEAVDIYVMPTRHQYLFRDILNQEDNY